MKIIDGRSDNRRKLIRLKPMSAQGFSFIDNFGGNSRASPIRLFRKAVTGLSLDSIIKQLCHQVVLSERNRGILQVQVYVDKIFLWFVKHEFVQRVREGYEK